MNKLNEQLYNSAKLFNACDKGISPIESMDKDELVELFKNNFEFTAENPSWITNKFIEDNFDKELRNSHNVFVNDTIYPIGKSGVYVVKGESNGEIKFSDFSAATLHISDMSNITIRTTGFSKVFINLYHMANVNIISEGNCKVYLYVRSNSCKYKYSGDVLIRERIKNV